MRRGLFSLIVLVGLALVLPSCSGTGEGLVPVSGKLVCDGQPAAGAILLFHRVSSAAGPGGKGSRRRDSIGHRRLRRHLFGRECRAGPRGSAWKVQRVDRVAAGD